MFLLTAVFVIVCILLVQTSQASADWRWAQPKFKVERVKPVCQMKFCRTLAKIQARANHRARVRHYNERKRAEWNTWTRLYIPDCTWFGESGFGERAEYARARYVEMNDAGSGARGKFQFMPRTYAANAKYGDWSPLDQEIAARREYWKHGIFPWESCTG